MQCFGHLVSLALLRIFKKTWWTDVLLYNDALKNTVINTLCQISWQKKLRENIPKNTLGNCMNVIYH